MEKSKQGTWMRKGESPVLPGEEREEEGMVGHHGVPQQRESFSLSGA
jgi:hypothetical protein